MNVTDKIVKNVMKVRELPPTHSVTNFFATSIFSCLDKLESRREAGAVAARGLPYLSRNSSFHYGNLKERRMDGRTDRRTHQIKFPLPKPYI